ncbi:MAG: hypothetical protein U0821_09330 [Chloroflexota bacterium]
MITDANADPVRDPGDDSIGGRDAVELYVRTYNTILRSSGDINIRAFEPAHVGVGSSLHQNAASSRPDPGAFIYSIQRLPACATRVGRVIVGQLPEQFGQLFDGGIDGWQKVEAPGRRRQWSFDNQQTLAVMIASVSDVDDVLPTIVAYQIEWNKLHDLLQRPLLAAVLATPAPPAESVVAHLGEDLGIPGSDWERLQRIWGDEFWSTLQAIAAQRKSFRLRMLGGTHVGYAKLVQRWWLPIEEALRDRGLLDRPIYFTSSNPHSVVNLVSGYVRRRADQLWEFLEHSADGEGLSELEYLRGQRGRSNPENVLYYASRLWHQHHTEAPAKEVRAHEEAEHGIITVDPHEGLDVAAQIIDLSRVTPEDVDPRLDEASSVVGRSDAVILNVDYPLGMAAYFVLRQALERLSAVKGVYVLGKAATLNGAVGDVMIADIVSDEHTKNVYSFTNVFTYDDVAPWLERGAVLDNQKAVTVRGTFLQNRAYLENFYREAYTVVEMEAGPYLSAVYEAAYADRHPMGESVRYRGLPFELGFIHYASDTPYTRARTLGSRRLSFEGIDSTYGSTVAMLRRILHAERERMSVER